MAPRTFIRHIVFFSAREAADVPRIVDGLSRLGEIPGSTMFEVRENTRVDQLSRDVDVVVYAEFPDAAALAAYKEHPIYRECIDVVRPLREMRVAADI